MEISSKITKIIYFVIFNLTLLILLYNVPVNSGIFNRLCIFKLITGNECWNCGMTRAFLCTLHFDLESAYQFNNKVIIVFPFTVGIYLYSWYNYIFLKGDVKHERKK